MTNSTTPAVPLSPDHPLAETHHLVHGELRAKDEVESPKNERQAAVEAGRQRQRKVERGET